MCIYVYICVYMCIYVYICVYMCIYIYMCIYVYTCVCVCVCVCICICTCICICMDHRYLHMCASTRQRSPKLEDEGTGLPGTRLFGNPSSGPGWEYAENDWSSSMSDCSGCLVLGMPRLEVPRLDVDFRDPTDVGSRSRSHSCRGPHSSLRHVPGCYDRDCDSYACKTPGCCQSSARNDPAASILPRLLLPPGCFSQSGGVGSSAGSAGHVQGLHPAFKDQLQAAKTTFLHAVAWTAPGLISRGM